MDKLELFTMEENNLLVRLLIAHLLSDFVLQSDKMVSNKGWTSGGLWMHISITIVTALALTGNLAIALFIGITHYFIDVSKTIITVRFPQKKFLWFLIDQALHIAVIVFVWAGSLGKFEEIIFSLKLFITDYKITLILLGYIFCIWPASYVVGYAVQSLLNNDTPLQNEKIENGGRWIGQFERVIIFTFVLLYQYEAIGFLITGKSIIRFADRDHIKSEYVLAGTMLSYALAIVSGALINWLLME